MSDRSDQLDPARVVACQILHEVLERGGWSNTTAAVLLEQPQLTARDRAFASAMVYGTIGRLVTIDYYLQKVSTRPLEQMDSWVRTILRLGVWQLYWSHAVPDHAAIDQSVRLCVRLGHSWAKGFVNAILRTLSREQPVIPARRHDLRAALPAELFGLLRHWFGEAAAIELAQASLSEQPSIDLRVNPLRADREQVLRLLNDAGFEAVPGRWLERAVRVFLQGHSVSSLPGFAEGLFSVQNEAAQLVGALSRVTRQMRVLDCCAAPGGKTTDLAERQGDQGRITAADLSQERLELVRQNLNRLGLQSVSLTCFDATLLAPDPHPDFDLVLLDVPCSGLGLLGRKPEIRLNMTYARIQDLLPLQQQMLQAQARQVAPGGCLIYSTCTVNPDENEGQIASFLQTEIGAAFRPRDMLPLLPAALVNDKTFDAARGQQARQGQITLLPHRDQCDGFFIALLERSADQGRETHA